MAVSTRANVRGSARVDDRVRASDSWSVGGKPRRGMRSLPRAQRER